LGRYSRRITGVCNNHRWMRKSANVNGKITLHKVRLVDVPLSTDFCRYCGASRVLVEGCLVEAE